MSDEHSEFVVQDDDKTGAAIVDGDELKEITSHEPDPEQRQDTRAVTHEAEGDAEEKAKPGETPQEKEARQSRNRETRDRKKAARERDRRIISSQNEQIRQLTERLSAVEGRTDAFSAAQIDQRLTEWETEMATADQAMRAALKAGDENGHTEALKRLMKANMAVESIKSFKQQQSNATKETPQRVTQVDPFVAQNISRFRSDHPWFDPQSGDEDSLVAQAVDKSVAQSFDPRTQEYWDELEIRLARRLPHRFRDAEAEKPAPRQQQQRQQPRQVVAGSGRDGGASQNGSAYVVSKDRRDALIEAGMWDRFRSDKAFRESMISEFKAADIQYGTR